MWWNPWAKAGDRAVPAAPPIVADAAETPAPSEPLAPPEPPAAGTEPPGESPAVVAQLEMQSEFLRLLEVVTSMCDHVIEYIEADRAERRLMIETLSELSRTITGGAAAALAPPAPTIASEIPAGPVTVSERVIGGSMPAGPEPVIDLVRPQPEPEWHLDGPPDIHLVADEDVDPADPADHTNGSSAPRIAVEVRGRFGDRWVDGFEICEVTTTADGQRYRLRRRRDGVVLPELFDATNIRHVETFEQLNGDQLRNSQGYWTRS